MCLDILPDAVAERTGVYFMEKLMLILLLFDKAKIPLPATILQRHT